MKKIVLFALLAALCLSLGGCLVVRQGPQTVNTVENSGTATKTEPIASTGSQPQTDDPSVAEAASYEDENLPEDVTYEAEEEYLPDDFEYESFDPDGEEDDFDIPRTLKPATAAQQRGVVKVDYVIDGKLFATQLDEISYYPEDFIGKNLQIEGYVLYPEGQDGTTQFAVVRDFQLPPHVHEEGEVVDHDHEEEIYPVGFDCAYTGTIPAENAWTRVIGTVVAYDYIDPDSGEVFPSMYLKLLSLEVLQEPSGARVITE